MIKVKKPQVRFSSDDEVRYKSIKLRAVLTEDRQTVLTEAYREIGNQSVSLAHVSKPEELPDITQLTKSLVVTKTYLSGFVAGLAEYNRSTHREFHKLLNCKPDQINVYSLETFPMQGVFQINFRVKCKENGILYVFEMCLEIRPPLPIPLMYHEKYDKEDKMDKSIWEIFI